MSLFLKIRKTLLSRRSYLQIDLLLVWLLVTTFLVGCEREKRSNPEKKKSEVTKTRELTESPQEGFLAPRFSLQEIGGKWINLEDFKGKVVLLNFWASWCAPCRREIPSMERLYQLRKDKDFEILAVNMEKAPLSKITSFVSNQGMSFPVLTNPQGEVSERYWVRAIPTSFIIDKEGVIRWKVVGGRMWDGPDVLSKIDQLLSE